MSKSITSTSKKRIECKNCGLKNGITSKYCRKCGKPLQKKEVENQQKEQSEQNKNRTQKSIETVSEEVLHFIFHIDQEMFHPAASLIISPGRSLRQFLQRKFTHSIKYFLVMIALYLALNYFVISKFDIEFLVSVDFGKYYSAIVLPMLLLGIAIIGYFTLGWRPGKGKRDYYSFVDVFKICLYIYGTNYFLAPSVIITSLYFEPWLQQFDPVTIGKLTDVPLAIFMMFMVFRLMKNTPRFKYLYPRFTFFVLFSYTYYYLMYDWVIKWAQVFKH